MQTNSAYAHKPGRPALPPRPYPPNTTFRSSILVPIALRTQQQPTAPAMLQHRIVTQPPPPVPQSSKSPSPTPTDEQGPSTMNVTVNVEDLLLSSATPPNNVDALDALSLHSPPQPASPTSVQRGAVLNVSHAASDADEEEDELINSPDDTAHIANDDEDDEAADDEGDDDDDDDASSTIAVRGVPIAAVDWPPMADGTPELHPVVTGSLRYASSASASASPMHHQHQNQQHQRTRSLNGSSSLVDSLPNGYDDDDDVRIFQCEHSSNPNDSSNGGGRRPVDRAGVPLASFTLARFLEHEAPSTPQPPQQKPSIAGDIVLVGQTSPLPEHHQQRQHHQPSWPLQTQPQHHHIHLHHQAAQPMVLPLPLPPQLPLPDCTSSPAINGQLHQLFTLLVTHHHPAQTARSLYDMSQSPEACAALRRARCIPLCVQIIHAADADPHTRRAARRALQNIVNAAHTEALASGGSGSIGADEVRRARRETRVLRHIEHVLDYCDDLKLMLYDRNGGSSAAVAADDRDRHPLQALSNLMKLSCSDEEHRQTMSQLGALQAIASIVHYDHAMHDETRGSGTGSWRPDDRCLALRRFAASTLTNLTFGDDTNKSILRSNMHFMRSLVGQLTDGVDDQLPANVLRNLSWRADAHMKQVLHEIGAVTALTRAVMRSAHTEATIMALLPPLWNLSAHSSSNRAEICALDGAIACLAELLVYVGPSRSWTVMENAGGILRNVSSHIAVNSEYREQLRRKNGLGTLLQQLGADSETIVSNACGTLWNLSARGEEDQRFLLDNGAVQRLGRLVESGNEMIVNMSSKALKNLLNCGVMPTPVAEGQRTAEYEAAVQRALRVRRALAEADGRRQPDAETVEFAPYLGVGGTPEEDGGGTDEMLPPLRLTAKTAQMLQKGFMQQHRKFYPSTLVSRASGGQQQPHQPQQQQQQPPTPPPRRSLAIHGDMPLAMPPAPPRRNPMMLQQHQQPHNLHQHQHHSVHPTASSSADVNSSRSFQETDLDQITDFSLRYGGDADAMCQHAMRSHALAPPPLPPTRRNIHQPAAVDRPEPDAPEQCTNYAEEGTPGMYESYSSLDGSLNGDAVDRRTDAGDDEVPVTYRHTEEEEEEAAAAAKEPDDDYDGDVHRKESDRVEHLMHDAADMVADSEEQRDQFPPLLQESFAPSGRTSPGGSSLRGGGGGGQLAAYDTPMMFSRHSSMGSLSSVEVHVQIGDDGQVVSDYSRLASGAISPSDIPDSPSQMGAQSPRRQSDGGPGAFPFNAMLDRLQPKTHPLRSVFADDVNAFGVENTPALISCATSLSGLSIDDDGAAAGESLLSRLMHRESGQVVPAVAAEAMRLSSDDEDSLVDDDDDQMLAACIQIGMKRSTAAQAPALVAAIDEQTVDDEVSTSWQPSQHDETNDVGGKLSPLFMDSDDDAGIDGQLERLQSTIQTAGDRIVGSAPLSPASPASPDSSGPSILELCIQSGMHKRPASSASTVVAVQTTANGQRPNCAAADAGRQSSSSADDDDSDLSDDGSGDASDLLAACINMGMKKTTAAPTVGPPHKSAPMPQSQPAAAPNVAQRDANHNNGWASDVSTDGGTDSADADSNDGDDATDVLLLQQCIRQGMLRKADGQSARSTVERAQQLAQPIVVDKVNVVANLVSSNTEESDSADDGEGMESILQQAIAIGSKGVGQSKSSAMTATTTAFHPDADAPTTNNARPGAYGSNSTTDDDNDDDDASNGLAQCIQMGMHKRPVHHPATVLPASNPGYRTAVMTTAQSATVTPARPQRTVQPMHQQQTLRFNAVAQAERERHMERERQRQRERQQQLDRDTGCPTIDHRQHSSQQQRLDKELLLHSIQASMGSRIGATAAAPISIGSVRDQSPAHAVQHPHSHLHLQQQLSSYQNHSLPYHQMQHHTHQSQHATCPLSAAAPSPVAAPAASGWPALAEYGCGCCMVGRYRCALHGGSVGGSLRRLRDDPLPPIPVDEATHDHATTTTAAAAASSSSSTSARRQRRVKKRSNSTSVMMRQQQQQQQMQQHQASRMPPAPLATPKSSTPSAPERNWI